MESRTSTQKRPSIGLFITLMMLGANLAVLGAPSAVAEHADDNFISNVSATAFDSGQQHTFTFDVTDPGETGSLTEGVDSITGVTLTVASLTWDASCSAAPGSITIDDSSGNLEFSGITTTPVTLTACFDAPRDLAASLDITFSTTEDEDTGSAPLDQSSPAASTQDVTIAISDADGPIFQSAATADSDNDGTADQITATFHENLAGSTSVGDWLVGGVVPSGVVSISGSSITLSIASLGGDALPNVQYLGSSLTDTAGNPAAVAAVTATDGVAPLLLTADGAPGGTTITLTFTEPMEASPVAGDFTYTDASGSASQSITDAARDSGDATRIILTVNPALAVADVGPSGDSIAAAGVTDASAAANTATGSSTITVPAPQMVSALTNVGSSNITLAFNRDVGAGPNGTATLTLDNFTLDGQLALTGMDDLGSTLNFTVHRAITLDDLLSGDMELGFFSNQVFDPVDGSALAPDAIAVADGTGPSILSVVTGDSNQDGALDRLIATFDEPVSVTGAQFGTNDPTNFTTAGGDAYVLEDGVTAVFNISSVHGQDTALTPNLTVSSGVVDQAGGNPFTGDIPATTDGAGAILGTALTRDIDADGRIDAIDVQFSEDLDLASASASHWIVDGRAITAFQETGCTATGDKTVRLCIREAPDYDTDAILSITFNNSASPMEDQGGAALPSREDVVTSLGTLPRLVAVEADIGAATAVLTFSEPVATADAWNKDLFSQNSAGLKVQSLNDAAPGGSIRAINVTLNRAVETADIGQAAIGVRADKTFTGTASRIVPNGHTARIALSVPASHIVADLTTMDGDGDGVLDGVNVTFVDAISVATLSTYDWLVDGVRPDSFVAQNVADGNATSVHFALNDSLELDTGAKPMVSHTSGNLTRGDGSFVPSFQRAAFDAARPVLLLATTYDQDADGTINGTILTFSEAIDATTLRTANFTIAGGAAALAAKSLINHPALPDDEVYLAYNAPANDTSLTPAVAYTGAILADLAGNKASVGGPLDGTVDGAAPVILTATTNDYTGSIGALDNVTVVLSEPLAPQATGNGTWDVDGFNDEEIVALTLSTLRINVTEGAVDSDVTPLITFTADMASPAHDAAGNAMATQSVVSIDGVAAGISAAVTDDVNKDGLLDTVNITFGGPVNATTFDAAAFSFGGIAADSGYVHVDSENATLNFTTTFGTGALPNLTFVAGTLTDADGATIVSHGGDDVNEADGARPVALAMHTIDTNGDGVLDGYNVTFSEAVLGTATGDIAGAFGLTTSIDGAWVEITTGLDNGTGDLPAISIDGGLHDSESNAVVPFNHTTVAPADGAGPVLLYVAADLGSAVGTLVFSEPLEQNIASATDLEILPYAGSGASTILAVTDTGDRQEFTVEFDTAVTNATVTGGQVVLDGLGSGTVYTDSAGNELSPKPAGFQDGTGPRLLRALTYGNGAGQLGGAILEFNEDVRASEINATRITIDDATVVSATLAAGETRFVDVAFTTANGTGATPTITLEAGFAVDLRGNESLESTMATLDGATPVVLSTLTKDANGDGHLDGLLITFSEPVESHAFNAATWGITGYTASGQTHDNATLMLTLDQKAQPDTGATPAVTYNNTTVSLADAAGNELANNTMLTPTDGAKPILWAVDATVGAAQVTAIFSEPVRVSGNAVASTDFRYFNDAPGGAIGVANNGATSMDDTTIVLTLTGAAITADDFGQDQISVKTGVKDVAGLEVDTTRKVHFSDVTAPSVVEAKTADLDQDGELDAVIVRFSEAVTAAGAAADWTITGRGHPTDVAFNDRNVTLEFAAAGDATNATLDVVLHNATVADSAGNQASAFATTATDGASAVLMVAETFDADGDGHLDQINLTFSEGEFSFDETAMFVDGFTVAADSYEVDSARTVILNITGDHETGTTGLLPALSGNESALASDGNSLVISGDLSYTDRAAPVLQHIKTGDADGNGILDHIRVQFSEAVAPQSGILETTPWNMPHHAETVTLEGDHIMIAFLEQTNATDELPVVSFTFPAQTFGDDEGNPHTEFSTSLQDGAAPVLLSAKTVDATGNGGVSDGILDGVTLTFSEEVVMLDKTNVTVAGATVTAATTAGNDVHVSFTSTMSTGARPLVTVNSTFGEDVEGNAARAATFEAFDGAKPVLLKAVVLGSQVFAEFSEGIHRNETGTKAVDVSAFAYKRTGGSAVTISGISHSPGSASATLTIAGNFANGDKLSVKDNVVKDATGNVALAKTVTAVKDTSPPATVTDLTATGFKAAAEGWSTTTSGSFSWKAPAGGSDRIKHYIVKLDGQALSTSPVTKTSVSVAAVADGTHLFTVAPVGKNNIVGPESAFSFKVDATKPVGATITSSTHPDALCGKERAASFAWSGASDARSGLAEKPFKVTFNGTTTETSNTTLSAAGLADGKHTLTLVTRDAAGNENTTTYTVGVDNAAPKVSLSGPARINKAFTVSWSSDDVCGVQDYTIEYRKDTGAWTAFSSGNATSKLLNESAAGTYEFRGKATDVLGHVGTFDANRTLKVVIDKTAPAAPGGLTATVSVGSVGLSWTASTADDVDHYRVYRSENGGSYAFLATSNTTRYADATVKDLTLYSYKVSAVDTAGNEGQQGAAKDVQVNFDLNTKHAGAGARENLTRLLGVDVSELKASKTGSRFDAIEGSGLHLSRVLRTPGFGNMDALLIAKDSSSRPTAIWIPDTDEVLPIKPIQVPASNLTQADTNDGTEVTVTVDKEEGWIEIQYPDPLTDRTIVSVKAGDRTIPAGQIFQEDGNVYIYDDPETTYTVLYTPDALPGAGDGTGGDGDGSGDGDGTGGSETTNGLPWWAWTLIIMAVLVAVGGGVGYYMYSRKQDEAWV